MKKLVLATHNKHKVQEFRALLGDIDVELLSLDDFPDVGEISEEEPTLQGNARTKASQAFRRLNLPCLGDDSGLEVYYLNKEPGAYSSRYAGPNATYADNCRKLLAKMKGVPPRRRAARFRCVLVFVAPNSPEILVEGVCNGVIAETPKGEHGFGYDPVFLPAGCNQTLAELEPALKNELSHRGKAVRNIKSRLKEYFSSH